MASQLPESQSQLWSCQSLQDGADALMAEAKEMEKTEADLLKEIEAGGSVISAWCDLLRKWKPH